MRGVLILEYEYLTVHAVTQYLKLKFDSDKYLKNIRMQAEIADINLRRGIYYLRLKDEMATMSAIIFTEYVDDTVQSLKQGDEIEVYGDINLYIKNGSYQFYIREVELAGVGKFYRQFNEMKERLQKEGLFNIEHKKKLPQFPQKIGLITASNSAALQDMLITLLNRYPLAEPVFFSATMQGQNAVKSIVTQLKNADAHDLDTIVLARGGGSYEDLIAFNDETLARTIFEMKTPIITGIGHEIDTTIADFVADLRAATPTAAIEAAVPDKNELKKKMMLLLNRSEFLYKTRIAYLKEQVSVLDKKLAAIHPRRLMQQDYAKLLFLQKRLLSPQLKEQIFRARQEYLSKLSEKLDATTAQQLLNRKNKLDNYKRVLDSVSPMTVLARGYAYVEQEDSVITTIESADMKLPLTVNLTNGMLICDIKEKKEYE